MKKDYQFDDRAINLIVSGLAMLPWGEVNQLIFDIQEQIKKLKEKKAPNKEKK